MYGCGLRISEAVQLQPKHVDATHGVIRVIGKGNKERLVPLAPALLAAMRRAWKTHGNRQWVFATGPQGNHVSAKTVQTVFRAVRAQAGLPDLVAPHSLRHAFATRLLEKGTDVRIVQILLGHASIRSTEIYTHLTEPIREQLRVKLNELIDGLKLHEPTDGLF